MKPITSKMLMRAVWEGMPKAVFIYTPLCGTCAAARRMLEVVEYMLPEGILSEMNIHDIPELVQQYQISSVPAVMLFDGQQDVPKMVYRMSSVEHLLSEIRKAVLK
ncbi:thioredoxin family protein [Paenibacillus xylanexedens]|uniref:Thioredoxin-like negative regulator of GroEL n=1 Tax=Paenibacillus xylanexedens TaxID=528191 RepID=A0ABS4RUP0_PAEXY|nr:thioredoxin family protein [Paenibacillus xylanexedens]MBP2245522.1 thioredoxin-like negative regulator of GroEL [Paenibacillus xylanexedens]